MASSKTNDADAQGSPEQYEVKFGFTAKQYKSLQAFLPESKTDSPPVQLNLASVQ
jgi:hypothetical protein